MTQQKELPYSASSFDLFRAIRELALPILLHSGRGKEQDNNRFDILVADPHLVFRYQHGVFSVEGENTQASAETAQPFRELNKYLEIIESDELRDEALPFTGGVLGYFAYSSLHRAYDIPEQNNLRPELPAILAGLYQWAIIVDHGLQRCTLVWQEQCSEEKLKRVQEALDIASPADESFRLLSSFEPNLDRKQYQKMFKQAMDYIHAGDCYQVNLAQCFQADCEGDSFSAFVRLQALAQAPFAAYMELGEQAVLSFSPERFLQVRDKQIIAQPIKGTRPRGSNKAQDQLMLQDLLNSEKDKAENLMIVDLLRNDLGKVCRTGSVKVEKLFEAHSFNNVHHLLSTISGELRSNTDVWRLLEACFPGGSITGTPKRRAMEIIDELETRPRSVYCGSIAWINEKGDMDSNIAIRTLVRDGQQLYCWGGGGIVADSSWQEEYQESLDKISLFLNALQAAS